MDATEEQIPYTHEFVVDAAYQRSLARALFAASFRRPWWWILLGIFLLLLESTLFSTVPWGVPVVWIVLVMAMVGFGSLRTSRVVVSAFPVGKLLKTGFGGAHFAITDGNDASVMAYSGFDEADVRGDVVWLRRTNPKRRLAYPRALFPDAELNRIRTAFGSHAPLSSVDSPQPTPGTPA